ncbi:MAG TPA: hypothetical protein PKM48_02280, partial [Parvularculaceae bacterium]|nr:hypothetical protein [Parvularculaceae bacterium]
MKKLAIAAALIASATGAASFVANAQTNDPEAGARLQATLEERALTRPRLAPPRIGQPAQRIEESRINWTEMRTALAISARRDSSGNQTTAAVIQRPPGLRASPAERFKTVTLREVNITRLPVLAPEGGRISQTLKVYSLGSSYSATAEVEDGVAMRMSGARKKIVVGDLRSARTRIAAMRKESRTLGSVDAPYLITRSESSTDLTFAKFGAGYVLSIMCDDPADKRCAEDDYITKLASNLLLLNPD